MPHPRSRALGHLLAVPRLSALPPRLQMDEELRREREREREADREREKEREQREQERQREQREQRAREKELPATKLLEPAFPPGAELHALRGHATEERVRSAEQLTPTRAGTGAGPSRGNHGRLGCRGVGQRLPHVLLTMSPGVPELGRAPSRWACGLQ